MNIQSILSKKSSGLFIIICIITFCCIFLTTHIVKSINSVKINRPVYKSVRETQLNNELKLILNCCNHQLQMETLQYGQYWLIKNYIRGRLSIYMQCAQSITYTTNGDYTFLGNLIPVVERWLAPISVAIFAPGYDYNATMDSIQYLRNCLPSSLLIQDYVTFHIYFPMDHFPSDVAQNEEEALEWPYDCELEIAPYENVQYTDMYKNQNNLTYPVNVGRNIARKAANTHFILASDIELYPSLGLVKQFLEMINNNPSIILSKNKPKVFPLPVFELKADAKLPNSKEELQNMLNTTMALPFHFKRCPGCHLIPRHYDWVKTKTTKNLEVFTIAQRYEKFSAWEPFYISDNTEPLFDERFSWEGQSDKRIQNYAMCLQDYEYHVLHPAFLVHTPGIKETNNKSPAFKRRMKYVEEMNRRIKNQIIPEYLQLYGNNTKCEI